MFYLKKVFCILAIIFSMSIGGFLAVITFANEPKNMDKTKETKKEVTKEVENHIDTMLNDEKFIKINAELTAYCDCEECSEEWGDITAMQTKTRVGVVAAPKEIKLGSKIYIPMLKDYTGDGIFSVEDRGGAVKIKDDGTYIIDIWIPSHDEVEKFGRKKCTVYLME